MDNKDNNVEVIDLREVFFYLFGNLIFIFLAAMIGAMGMYFFSRTMINRKYQSSTSIYVLNQQDNQTVTYSDLQTGTQLTKDYAQLVKSRTVTTSVIAELDLQNRYSDMRNITPDALSNMIGVSTPQDTRIITITITDTDPTRAQDIANAVRVAASAHIYDVMDIEAVNIVDYANLPERPVSPSYLKNTIIGMFLGGFICIGILMILFVSDDTIKTPDDVERYLGLSVLASIPYDESSDTALSKKGKKGKKTKKK